MKLERVIEYDARASDSLQLVLAVAKEYREADAAMKPVLLKALQHFLNPPMMVRKVPDAPKPVDTPTIAGNGPVTSTSCRADQLPEGTQVSLTMPDIPDNLRRP